MGRVWQPSSQEARLVLWLVLADGLRPVYEFPSASVTRGWESRHRAAVEAGPWPGGEGLAGGDHGSPLCAFMGRSDRGRGQGPASRKVDRRVQRTSSVH